MGIEGAFPYLLARGVGGTAVELNSIDGTIHVDLLSLLRAYIDATRKSILIGLLLERAKDLRDVEVCKETTQRLTVCLSKKLKQIGLEPGKVVLHIDGSPTVQKTKARTQRMDAANEDTRNVQLQILRATLAAHIPPRPRDLDPPNGSLVLTPPPSRASMIESEEQMQVGRAQMNKALRTARRATKSYKAVGVMGREFLGDLAEALSAEWEVHRCRGEADVCIPAHTQDTVATIDSDFLFHGVSIVLRQDPQSRSKLLRYDMDEILHQPHLTWPMWRVAAIVSNNDYSYHVPGCGFLTNVDLIRSIAGASAMDEESLLSRYCNKVASTRDIPDLTPQRYEQACSIFLRLHEDIQEFPPPTNALDQEIADMIQTVAAFKRLYRMQHSDASTQPGSGVRTSERGYLRMTPGTRFKARAYLKRDRETDQETLTRKRKRKARRKRKNKGRKRQRKYGRATKDMRKSIDAQPRQPSRKNILKPATVAKNCLKHYGTITMNCGTVTNQLRRALTANNIGRSEERQRIARYIAHIMREMVRIGTITTQHAAHALSLYITQVMADYPSPTDIHDIQRRKEAFEYIANLHTESCMFGSLLQRLYDWNDPADGPKRGRRLNNAKDDNICLDRIVRCYRQFMAETGQPVPDVKDVIRTGLSVFLRQAGDTLRDTLQVHVRTNIPELVDRLREYNPQWISCDEGRSFISTIDDPGRSSQHDAISLFYFLDCHLPPAQQMAFNPEGGLGDKFFNITEEALMHVILRHDPADKDTDLMRTVLGNAKQAQEHLNEHPGDLIYSLFLSEKLDYTRSTCLINPRQQPLLRQRSL